MSQLIWLLLSKVMLPAGLAELGALFPPFAFLLGIPIIGPYIRGKIEDLIKSLFDKGVFNIKAEMLDHYSAEAKKGYEPMIEMLREAQNKEFLSEEEEQAYEEALKKSVQNHPSVVHG